MRGPWLLRACAWLIEVSNHRFARILSLAVAHLALLFRRMVPGRWLERGLLAFVRMEASCCRQDSAFYKMMAKNADRFEAAGTFERMRSFLVEAPRPIAARRLDAWVRIAAFTALRHEVLNRRRGEPGVAPRALTQAQLALSSACDLKCEGCYTAEDRGGKAPQREEMAFLIDEAAACGAFGIHIIGKGEPFLSKRWAAQLLDVMEARPHLFFTVATHGLHIDDALAERLARMGNVIVLIAVDGPEAMHDARRGEGTYRRIHEVFARLRQAGALFGYSCMVSAKSAVALTSRAFVEEQMEAGCSVGIYSRYFALAADQAPALSLSASDLRQYQTSFVEAQSDFGIPLFDLDEVESRSGCQSRAGESVYIDGVTGQVAPCLRVPFAPDAVRLVRAEGKGLVAALSHPFFEAYRTREAGCPSWCGANMDGELKSVASLLSRHEVQSDRLDAFAARAGGQTPPLRRLPVLTANHPT